LKNGGEGDIDLDFFNFGDLAIGNIKAYDSDQERNSLASSS